jgi:glycosyltransferase involved in cell wall biosynthesis
VPWIGALAHLLRQQPGVVLTVLHWTHRIESDIEEVERDGIRFIYLKVPTVRVDILTLYQRRIALVKAYLKRNYRAYDLLHLHGSELQVPAMTARLPVPQLLSVQGLVSQYPPFVPGSEKWLKALWTLSGYYERRYLPAVQHFICRTHWDQALVRQLSPGCTIYHNWEVLRPAFFRPIEPLKTSRLQVVFLGGTQVMKGFREVLAAVDLLRQQLDVTLVITGQANPELVQAAVQASELNHLDAAAIECRGLLSAAELAQLFSESLCLLHPSYVDNSPNSVCEAQVAGLPVVASDVGGVRSLIEDEVTGLLCTLEPDSIARQARRLHDDPALRQRLAVQAATVARQRHDPTVIVAQTLAIYADVVAASHVGS